MFGDTRDSIHKRCPRLSRVSPPQSRNCGALATERGSRLGHPSMDRWKSPASRQSICLSLGPVTAPLLVNRCQYDNRLRKVNFFSKSVLKARVCADFSQFSEIRNILRVRALPLFLICENSATFQATAQPWTELVPTNIQHPAHPSMERFQLLVRPTFLATRRENRINPRLSVLRWPFSPCSSLRYAGGNGS